MTNDVRRDVAPPLVARAILRWVAARRHGEFAVGDLEEEFQDLVDSPLGLRGARRWYWQQVWQCISGPDAPKPTETHSRSGNRAGLLDRLKRDLRYAIRSLTKTPAFVAAAVFTLALGIGPNTAIFSIVDAVLLRPLNFRDADRLVVVWETDKSDGNQAWRVAPANYVDWKEQASAFEDVAAFGANFAAWNGHGTPMQLKGSAVTANYFSVLGVQPILGRGFLPTDATSSAPVIVLGYDFWRSNLAGSGNVIGAPLVLDGAPLTVIGVMPPGIYPSWPVNGPRIYFQSEYQDFWTLLSSDIMTRRRSHVLGVVARMKSEVSLSGAQQQMDTIARRLEKEYAEDKDEGALVRPLMDEVAGTVRPALLILLAAVGSVLLIACSNVAGLLLARLTSRRHEIAVRTALGAGRSALLSQFFMEGLLLALLAGAAGILFAVESHQLLLRLVPQEIPRLENARLNARVLAFALGTSFLAALSFTLVPAWAALRLNISGALKETSRGNDGVPSQRLRQLLVMAQVGFAVVLTVSAGLLAQSFWRLKQVNPGFKPDHLMVAELVLPGSKYDTWQEIKNFYEQLLDRTRHLPGVLSANIAYDHPLEDNWLTGFSVEGEPGDKSATVQLRIVSPGYFAGVGPALLEGREFNQDEDHRRPGVAVVNESFRRRYLSGGKALGRTVFCTAASSNWKDQMPDRFQIVGVVADVQPPGLGARTEPFLYVSSWQFPRWEMKLLIRTRVEPAAAAAAVRRTVAGLDSRLPVTKVTTMDRVMTQAVAQPRLNMVMMLLFGAFALILALVGIYGLIAFWVAARRREIGMRVALGATPSSVMLLVLQSGGKLVAGGVVAGTLSALALSRFLQSQLFGISAVDPVTYVAVPVLVLAVGLAACLIPARAAARVDPMIALRND